MYFVKIEPLKQKLREQTLTEREALPYYIILMAGVTLMPLFARPASDLSSVLTFACTALVVLGIIYSYDKNGGRSGSDFILKSVTLGWVLSIRLLAFVIPLALGIGMLKSILGLPINETSWVEMVFSPAITCVYYALLGRHLKDTKKVAAEQRFTVCPELPGRGPSG
ncbi:MAG: hypothetical protein NTY53_18710 [Kiritimatiellaeota bacterium]|nr:hypothetical protein [Kiritimatiellota bacterium]